MKKNTIKFLSFIFSLVLFLISFNSFSNTYTDTISDVKTNNPITLSSQKKSSNFSHYSKNEEYQFTEAYIKKNFPVADPTNKNLNKAIELFKEIDLNNNIIDFLEPKNLASLPIGVKKTINGIQYMLGISNAKFTPEYTELTAFVRIILPQINAAGKQEQLFFGANNIKLSHKGGLIGDTNLVLLGDVPLKILGNQALLVLKGGMDMATGNIENKTYVKIDCSGFKELGIAADVQFSQKIIKPVDVDNNVIPDKSVIGSFQTSASNWNDILIELSLPKFQISTFNGLIFEIKNAKIDLSDIRNPDKINWPSNYQTDYLVPGNEQLWRGLYANTVDITLPEEFQIAGSSKRISFSAKDLLIDGMGVSGTFTGTNILDLKEGSASGWAFSVNSINLGFKANTLVSGGFGGSIVLPISDPEKKCAAGANIALAYNASINPIDHEYLLRADVNKKLCFQIFKATANIEKGSYVELKVKDGNFLPKALLNGNITIAVGLSEPSEVEQSKEKDPRAPVTTYMYENGASSGPLYDMKNVTNDPKETSKTETDDTKKIVFFDGVIFQNLQLQTVTPIIKADYFGYKNNFDEDPKSSKVANFPITIHEIALIADDNSAALRVDLSINLMEGQFNGRTKFDLVGRFNEKSGIKKWKFDYVKFQRIDLAADIGGAKFEGSITIMDNDPVYGKGFKGNLKAEFKGGIIVEANAIFGKMSTFRYWYVDAMVDGLNIPCSAFVIKGFGGGAYYNMKKEGFSSTFTASGVQYVPDEASSLGIKAMIHFANAASPNAFWGGAGFEIAFNDHGGINRISIYGEGHVMQEFGFKTPLSSLKQNLREVSLKEGTYPKETLDKLKESNLIEASKEVYPDRVSGQAGLNAYAAIEYDFTTKTLHGTFDLYVDVAGGIIKGRASKNRAGWAVLHFAPDKWYVLMGTPQDRLGLKMTIGPVEVEAGGYFMLGDDIPASPPPPAIVAQLLRVDLSKLDYMRDENSIASGKGFAFGSDFSIKTGNLSFLMFYANFQAGFGFDIMVKDYGEAQCKGSGQIGINGWYANGQSYAYLQGELGINIKLFFIRKKISIIKGGGAVLLQAKLPNPVWIRGYMAGEFSLLGGAVRGSFRFKLEFGEQCEFLSANPLEGLKSIADITPAQGTKDVDVFTIPQVGFNMPVDKNFNIEGDDGVKTYRLKLEEYTIKKDGVPVIGTLSWNKTNDLLSFNSAEILPEKSDLTLTVKVSFQEYTNGAWKTILDQGQVAMETETRNFSTGVAPNNIPVSNIAYCYPVFDQKYVYQNESKEAYVVLKTGQAYLFDLKPGQSQKAFYKTGTKTTNGPISYNSTLKRVILGLPVLENVKPYSLTLMTLETTKDVNTNLNENFEKQDLGANANVEVKNNKLGETLTGGQGVELLQYNFNTSQYNTFQEKMVAKKARKTYIEIVEADIHALHAENASTEPFEEIEIVGNTKTMNVPLVNVEAILDNSYFTNDIYPLIYKGYPLEADLTLNRNTSLLGNPPTKGVELITSYLSDLINNPKSSYLRDRLPYRYNQPFYYKDDFIKIQYKVVNKYLNGQNQPMKDKYSYIINGRFPMIKDGTYNVRLNYTLPGGQAGTSSIFTFNKTN